MQGSKITLSPAELDLFCNAEVILTKNRIIEKTVALLATVQEDLLADRHLLKEPSLPKISKGENYQGLPYVVLDYPRISSGEDLFFIRSMFWWGQFFSSTLQVAGRYKQQLITKTIDRYYELAAGPYHLGIQADPWQHHFEADNYRKISSFSLQEFKDRLQQQAHIKIAASWPLSQWDMAANHLVSSWQYLAGLVA